MASLREDLAADYADAIGGYEQTFRWNGANFPCVRTTEAAAIVLVDGGEEIEASDRITVSISDLPGRQRPAYGDLVDGNRLQIVKIDPNVAHWVLWCAPPLNMGKTH